MVDFSKATGREVVVAGGSEDVSPAIETSDDFEKYLNAQKRARIHQDEKRIGPPKPFVGQCHVCTHPHRDFIDTLLARGNLSYSHIARSVGPAKNGRMLDHRQVSNHAKKHLGHGDLAIRAILEQEAAEAGQNFEDSVRGAITHRGGLEVAFRKAFEDIVNNVASVEPRDMIAIAKQLREWDQQTAELQVDFYKAQVHAIEEAIKDIVPKELWGDIAAQARKNLERDGTIAALPETTEDKALAPV